jgi:hypothetical protein
MQVSVRLLTGLAVTEHASLNLSFGVLSLALPGFYARLGGRYHF